MLLECREYGLVPVGEDTIYRVAESFCQWQVFLAHTFVARIHERRARILFLHRRRGNIVAATPDEYLLVPVLLGSLGLVEALQHAVVLLVQTPGLLHRYPIQVHYIEDTVKGLDGTFEIGSIGFGKLKAFFLHELAGFLGFFNTFFGQIHICPSRKAIFLVPQAFAVANQYYSFHNYTVIKVRCENND